MSARRCTYRASRTPADGVTIGPNVHTVMARPAVRRAVTRGARIMAWVMGLKPEEIVREIKIIATSDISDFHKDNHERRWLPNLADEVEEIDEDAEGADEALEDVLWRLTGCIERARERLP
jgi:hypothetical protein